MLACESFIDGKFKSKHKGISPILKSILLQSIIKVGDVDKALYFKDYKTTLKRLFFEINHD